MACKKGESIYSFCINSPHYEDDFLEYVKKHKDNNDVVKDIKCNSLKNTRTLFGVSSAEDICKEFVLLYKYYSARSTNEHDQDNIISVGNCDFLNYWLNSKLRKSVNDGVVIDVKDFYKEIKNKNKGIFSDNKNFEDYMNNIDPKILRNMELLYELYYNRRKVLSAFPPHNEDSNNECSYYTKECHEKYNKAISMCYGIYDEFYKALKEFKKSYNSIFRLRTEYGYNCGGNSQYLLTEHDPVLEREEKKIRLIQGLTSSLIFLLIIPVIYKVTKISLIKD